MVPPMVHRTQIAASIWAAAVLCSGQSGVPELPAISEMLAAKDRFFAAAVHPETHLIYSRVDLTNGPPWAHVVFPRPEDIRGKLNADREVPNVSNCAMAGGLFLGQLVDIHDLTGDAAAAEQARVVFDGLTRLASASERKGFIARCILPGDPTKAHFNNSSVDQYTFYVYGLHKYFRSRIASDSERETMRRIMDEICNSIERDNTILASNGEPAWVSDIEAIRADRSSRLLEVFLVGHAITGKPHWRDVYLEAVRQAGAQRLRTLLDPDMVRYTYAPRDRKRGPEYADLNSMWQTQYSLVPLVELEYDIAMKAAYLDAMRLNASIAERYGRGGFELQIIALAQNRGVVESVVTDRDRQYWSALAARAATLLARTPMSATEMPRGDALASSITHIGVPFVAAGDIYWTGIARRLFTARR
jgi:hypothetical protein